MSQVVEIIKETIQEQIHESLLERLVQECRESIEAKLKEELEPMIKEISIEKIEQIRSAMTMSEHFDVNVRIRNESAQSVTDRSLPAQSILAEARKYRV